MKGSPGRRRRVLDPDLMASIRRYDDAVVPVFATPFTRVMVDVITDSGIGPILDIGCGSGATARAVIHEWPNAAVTGVDSSIECLVIAGARSSKTLRWVCADACRLPVATGSTGLVVAQQLVQFLDYPTFAAEMYRVLLPGGRCIVLSWSSGGNPMLATLDRIAVETGLSEAPPWERAQSFDRKSLLQAAQSSGLDVLECSTVEIDCALSDPAPFASYFIPDPSPEGALARDLAIGSLKSPQRLSADLLVLERQALKAVSN